MVRRRLAVHHRLPAGRHRARRAARPVGAARRSAPPARRLPADGFRWVYEAVSPDVMLSPISGGTDVCSAFVGGNPLTPVWEGEIPCRYLGCRRGGVRRGRPVRGGGAGRAGRHPADAVDAGRLLGRRRRLAVPRRLLRALPRRVAPRRLGHDHRARQLHDHRPLRRHAQPRWRARRHGRDLPRRRGGRRCRRQPRRAPRGRRRRPIRGRSCCSSCSPTATQLDDATATRIRDGAAHRPVAAARARRGASRWRRSRPR